MVCAKESISHGIPRSGLDTTLEHCKTFKSVVAEFCLLLLIPNRLLLLGEHIDIVIRLILIFTYLSTFRFLPIILLASIALAFIHITIYLDLALILLHFSDLLHLRSLGFGQFVD